MNKTEKQFKEYMEKNIHVKDTYDVIAKPYVVQYVDFGIIERPRQDLKITKSIAINDSPIKTTKKATFRLPAYASS